ncbi:MAG TPA: hypothetical protein VNA30_04735 [Mycobacteriales bacterium]|nr:hypothetical protein [Mycobacteriales bacterium]
MKRDKAVMSARTDPAGRGIAGIAVLAAAALLASTGLFGCARDAAAAATTLVDPVSASVRAPDGTRREATGSTEVAPGSTVEVAAGGSATLLTRGRAVLLGAGSAVQVLDGVRQVLRQGQVMVDGRDAPGLRLDAGAVVVNIPAEGVSRVERAEQVRVGVFARTAGVVVAGRRATTEVPALFQVHVPFGGLPGRTTPLALTGDSWERLVARSLLEDDAALRSLADGFAPGPAATVLAALPSAAPTPSPVGEHALSAVLANVGRAGADSERIAKVPALRAEGGSWGVVAALVDADVNNVTSLIDRLLRTIGGLSPDGSPGSGFGPGGTAASPGPGGQQPSPQPSGSPRPQPSGSGPPTATSSPSPSSSPGVVDEVIDTVLDLLPPLPVPVPTPTRASLPLAPR